MIIKRNKKIYYRRFATYGLYKKRLNLGNSSNCMVPSWSFDNPRDILVILYELYI